MGLRLQNQRQDVRVHEHVRGRSTGPSLWGLGGVAIWLLAMGGSPSLALDRSSSAGIEPAATGLPTVNILLVAKNNFSFGPEEITSEPLSDAPTFTAGEVFVLELWAQTDDPSGLVAVSADITFDPTQVVATGNNVFPFSGSIFHGFVFSGLTNGTADNANGKIEDISGAYVPGGGCVASPTGVGPTNWTRVAVVEMQSLGDTSPMILSNGTGSPIFGTAVCGMANSPESQITYVGINTQSADINGDAVVDLLDHQSFHMCLTAPLPGAVAPECLPADFDEDDDVDLQDWGRFQSLFE